MKYVKIILAFFLLAVSASFADGFDELLERSGSVATAGETLYTAAATEATRDASELTLQYIATTPGVYTYDQLTDAGAVRTKISGQYYYPIEYEVDGETYTSLGYTLSTNGMVGDNLINYPSYFVTIDESSTETSGYTSMYLPGNTKYNIKIRATGGDSRTEASYYSIAFYAHHIDDESDPGTLIYRFNSKNYTRNTATNTTNFRFTAPSDIRDNTVMEVRFFNNGSTFESGYVHGTVMFSAITTIGDYYDGIYTGQ